MHACRCTLVGKTPTTRFPRPTNGRPITRTNQHTEHASQHAVRGGPSQPGMQANAQVHSTAPRGCKCSTQGAGVKCSRACRQAHQHPMYTCAACAACHSCSATHSVPPTLLPPAGPSRKTCGGALQPKSTATERTTNDNHQPSYPHGAKYSCGAPAAKQAAGGHGDQGMHLRK